MYRFKVRFNAVAKRFCVVTSIFNDNDDDDDDDDNNDDDDN